MIGPSVLSLLSLSDINYLKWGIKAGTKPIKNLIKEVMNNETRLCLTSDKIVRLCQVSYVIVRYKDMVLVEEKTIWKDGRPERRRALPGSIAEKARFNETKEEAAIRGLEEELGIIAFPKLQLVRKYEQDSPAYPGLLSCFEDAIFEVTLEDKEYKKGGYIEKDNEKGTFFIWKPYDMSLFTERTIILDTYVKDELPPGFSR
jgi:8-oxo-dGTP pyrophosphatase MutT (NUDIX family)